MKTSDAMKPINAANISYSGRLYAEEVLARGWVPDLHGARQTIRGPVSADEARFLRA